MGKLYDRRIEILIDGDPVIEAREGRQFKMIFDVLIDFGSYNSYADLVLVNMSAATVNLFKKDTELTIKAGYIDDYDVIFKGFIKNFIPGREGPNTTFRVVARGTQPTLDRTPATIALGKPALFTDVLQGVVAATGLPIVFNPGDFADVKPYPRGYSFTGDPVAELNNLADIHGFSWAVENGRVVVVGDGASRLGFPHEISQFEGMEGIPEVTEVGADVSIRLNPSIKVGDVFEITSNYKDVNFSNIYFQDVPESAGLGQYKVIRLGHSGDTWGNTWTTRLTGIRKPD